MRPAARLEGDSKQKRARCGTEAHLHEASSIDSAAVELARSVTLLCGALISFWLNLSTPRPQCAKGTAQRADGTPRLCALPLVLDVGEIDPSAKSSSCVRDTPQIIASEEVRVRHTGDSRSIGEFLQEREIHEG